MFKYNYSCCIQKQFEFGTQKYTHQQTVYFERKNLNYVSNYLNVKKKNYIFGPSYGILGSLSTRVGR
jgi:hypothetical protein